jgi:hypothetical protein
LTLANNTIEFFLRLLLDFWMAYHHQQKRVDGRYGRIGAA